MAASCPPESCGTRPGSAGGWGLSGEPGRGWGLSGELGSARGWGLLGEPGRGGACQVSWDQQGGGVCQVSQAGVGLVG